MTTLVDPTESTLVASAASGCPVNHEFLSRQKSARNEGEMAPPAPDADGVWHVHDFQSARAVLRSTDSHQAGFLVENMRKVNPGSRNDPVIFQEGTSHREQRKATARYFTPIAVNSNYRELMEEASDRLVTQLQARGRGNLSRMSMVLAVEVAGRVVGLTNSRLPGMARRLERFFAVQTMPTSRRSVHYWTTAARMNSAIGSFFLLDVRPAIAARRKEPQDDVISYLLSQGYNEQEILIECITFGAAGMVTTREFIQVAAWHMLENRELREMYLAGDDATREKILNETLRLEPVVSHLYRRLVAPITITQDGHTVTIPAGAKVDVHIQSANQDESVTGPNPELLCPAREIRQPKVSDMLMGFGDGHHRCPGAYIAIQESDIFLKKLLALPSLHIIRPPALTWNSLTQGYELDGFRIGVS